MFLIYLASGALAGAVLRDRRALSTIFPAAAVLVFLGVRDQHFADWLTGLACFFGHMACFEAGLALAGLGTACLARATQSRRFTPGAARRQARVN